MCQVQRGPTNLGHGLGCTCGCCGCGCGPWPRHFIAPAEEKEMLEKYRDFLKNELVGLENRLKEVEACSN